MASSLTEFGRRCREHRAVRHCVMADQAKALGCSVAFVSAVETGVKAVPAKYAERFAAWLRLSTQEHHELVLLSDREARVVVLHPKDRNKAEIAQRFSRRLNSLTAAEIVQLRTLVGEDA